jgi:hypothetical protein
VQGFPAATVYDVAEATGRSHDSASGILDWHVRQGYAKRLDPVWDETRGFFMRRFAATREGVARVRTRTALATPKEASGLTR